MRLGSHPKRLVTWLLALAAITVLVASLACSGGGDNGDDGNGDGVTPTATEPANGDGGDGNGGGEVSFDVSMGDNFFEPSEFAVAPGAAVTFNLTNEGTAIHNMRVAGSDNEFNSDDDAVSEPDLISAGDGGTLEWTAPDEPGDIKFQCDLHPTDMFGTITVE